MLNKLSLIPSGKEKDQAEQLPELIESLKLGCTDRQDADKAGVLEIIFERVWVKEESDSRKWVPEEDGTEGGTDTKVCEYVGKAF